MCPYIELGRWEHWLAAASMASIVIAVRSPSLHRRAQWGHKNEFVLVLV